MAEEISNKKVDEDWKQKIKQEKEAVSAKPKEKPRYDEYDEPESLFESFVENLALRALINLGVTPNPITGQNEKDLNQAKYLIDTLEMLGKKTNGNLTANESKKLDEILHELRLAFVKVQKTK